MTRRGARRSRPARLLVGLVRGYQHYVSPALPPSCRFYPSCSAYAAEALERHGALRGTWLSVRRLLRCHPWHRGGYDPVPPAAQPDPPAPDAQPDPLTPAARDAATPSPPSGAS